MNRHAAFGRTVVQAILTLAAGAAGRFSEVVQAQQASPAATSQALDAYYTAKIHEYTIDPSFLSELVDHLPASDTIPSPQKVLGYVVGTPNKLTYTKDLYKYYRALAAHQTHGQFMLVLNAALNFDHLDAGHVLPQESASSGN